jgi:phosphoesterase RecJ-like protein
LVNRSIEAVRYWGAGLSQLNLENRIIWTTLSLKDRKAADYSGRDDADLINLLSTINGIDVALIFVEQDKEKVKVSWRSRPSLDVSKIAAQFGGGGHAAASGAIILGTLKDVEARVIETTMSVIMKVSL